MEGLISLLKARMTELIAHGKVCGCAGAKLGSSLESLLSNGHNPHARTLPEQADRISKTLSLQCVAGILLLGSAQSLAAHSMIIKGRI